MPIERLKPTFSLTEERLRALEEVVPEAFEDGRINWETLREVLGERVEEDDAGAEHFGLFWPGKREARRLAAQPSKGTLVPAPGEGVDEETTENIFIEGDNLEVLKLLQKSYAGRIKMIYIDPPYNTGNDLIYKDNFTEPLEEYLKKTGQMGEQGELLTTNTKASGRFHSNWLNMMYPRLRLLQCLLAEDGFICVSIDDNEVNNLGLLMDEIFGSTARLACAPWLAEPSGGKEKTGLRSGHEYLLIYGNIERITQEERPIGELNLKDKWGEYRKGRELRKWGGISLRSDRPNQWFELTTPDGTKVYPYRNDGKEGHWRWGKNQKMKEIVENPEKAHWEKRSYDEGVVVEGETERWVPFEKIRDTLHSVGWSTWLDSHGFNADGTRELKELFGFKILDTPKPTKLIQWLLSLHDDDEALVLDVFAGSASTAHAVLKLNQQEGGNRKFICVQLPEKTNREDYATIAEIGKERIRRIINILNENENRQLPTGDGYQDRGFKVFTLQNSNFKAWRDYEGENLRQFETLLSTFETPLVEGWNERDVLTEILLLEGFPLSSRIAPAIDFTANKVMQVESDFSAHRIFICLDPDVKGKTIERLAVLPAEDIFICLDSALDDAAKVRLNDVGNVRTV
jgi:adenine-specific DNA-methyltransferase